MNGEKTNRFDMLGADELLALSGHDVDNGRLEEALIKLKWLINEAQPTVEAISAAARLYAQLKLFDRAETLFRQCLELDPEAITELFQLGMCLFDGGKPDEALLVWDQVIQRQPLHPPALFYKALLFAKRGEVDVARDLLDRLLRQIPSDNLYYSRARELLRDLDNLQESATRTQTADALMAVDKDAYKTIQ